MTTLRAKVDRWLRERYVGQVAPDDPHELLEVVRRHDAETTAPVPPAEVSFTPAPRERDLLVQSLRNVARAILDTSESGDDSRASALLTLAVLIERGLLHTLPEPKLSRLVHEFRGPPLVPPEPDPPPRITACPHVSNEEEPGA